MIYIYITYNGMHESFSPFTFISTFIFTRKIEISKTSKLNGGTKITQIFKDILKTYPKATVGI